LSSRRPESSSAIVARNAFFAFLAVAASNLISFVTLPLIARSLGSFEYGTWWLASTIAAFAAMFVESGQDVYVNLAVARQQDRAPELLATTLRLRLTTGILLVLPLDGLMRLLGYGAYTRTTALLLFGSFVLASIANGAMSILRGLERMGGPSAVRVVTEAVRAAFLFVAIWLGARVRGLAGVEVAGDALGLLLSLYVVSRFVVGRGRFSLPVARALIRGSAPFFFWSGIIVLQPALESILLSKLASQDAIGWYGAAAKLSTVLLFPATVIGGALMPTLARLKATDHEAYRRAVTESIRVALLTGAPIAIGTFIFADRGISLVFGASFGPAADNLRVLSAYLLPVFVNMSLGAVLIIAGKQFQWAVAKGAMVLVSAVFSYIAIPYLHARTGNGGLGAAAATVAAEAGMFAIALILLPRGLLGGRAVLDLGRALVAGAAMALVGHLLASTPFAVAMICALLAYGAALILVGGIGARELTLLRNTVRARTGGA
jgi:polysaccharide transporter, PST family